MPFEVDFAPFNQIFQELLNPGSEFALNTSGLNATLIRLEDLAGDDLNEQKLRSNTMELQKAFLAAAQNRNAPSLLLLCPPSAATLSSPSKQALLADVEASLVSSLAGINGLYVRSSAQVSQGCTVEAYDNPIGHRIGSVPYTPPFYSQLALGLARFAYRLFAAPHKVIVLDCDQTIWKGVCGEDGPVGIEINSSRQFLQKFMVAQSEAGMVLCLCSKNNEADVWEVFAKRPEMPMKRDHFVSSRINWEPKSANLKSLAQELQLGLESFIFVDDDGAVCEEVRSNCPEVLTIRLPENDSQIGNYFLNHWAFDHLQVTAEDRQRTELYRANAQRNRAREAVSSMGDFLKTLGLVCEIQPLAQDDLPRVAQLTQRTNQFNCTTIRRTEAELQQLLISGRTCLAVRVRDRFGDYGLVGAMIFCPAGDALAVDTLLLSCRALGRGVEHQMVSRLGKETLARKLALVRISFVPTEKNQPARNFLEKTGSAFKAEEGLTSVFSYPAAVAAALTFSSDDKPANVTEDSSSRLAQSQSGTRPPPANVAQAMDSIARELHSPAALLARITPSQAARQRLQSSYVAPRNNLEAALAKLWEQALRIQPIGVTDDYFELGGDSLTAVSLFVEMEETLGKQLSLATLITSPTIEKLAMLLAAGSASGTYRHLVEIQRGNGGPPLFCMHAAGGNVLFYRDLARHLGANQSVYGLQAREMPETGAYLDTVEAMTSEYVQEISRFQPQGPYYLCGSSFGGLLAYEASRLLAERGETIGVVALFDTYGPGYPQRLPSASGWTAILSRFVMRVQNLRGQLQLLNQAEVARFLAAKARKMTKKLQRKWLWKKNEFDLRYRRSFGKGLPKDLQRNHKAINHALHSYVPKPYPGKLTLFRAASQPKGIVEDPYLGWRDLPLKGLEMFESPGIHGAMTVDPYASSLAQQLLPILRRAPLSQHQLLRNAQAASCGTACFAAVRYSSTF
jgi:FkbH-like protein